MNLENSAWASHKTSKFLLLLINQNVWNLMMLVLGKPVNLCIFYIVIFVCDSQLAPAFAVNNQYYV